MVGAQSLQSSHICFHVLEKRYYMVETHAYIYVAANPVSFSVSLSLSMCISIFLGAGERERGRVCPNFFDSFASKPSQSTFWHAPGGLSLRNHKASDSKSTRPCSSSDFADRCPPLHHRHQSGHPPRPPKLQIRTIQTV